MTPSATHKTRSLAQSLAIQTQVHLPGTAGRLLKQIRDIERIAPLFVEAGLIRSVDRPRPLDVSAVGISTRTVVKRAAGGFLYAAAGSCVDIVVEENVVTTRGEDSVCEIDDIDYEDQAKRFQLIGMRQAYELADRALSSAEPYDIVLMDCPLLLYYFLANSEGNFMDVADQAAVSGYANEQTCSQWFGPFGHFEAPLPWHQWCSMILLQAEHVRPGLAANFQQVAKSLRGNQRHCRPTTLQQGVGGHGCAMGQTRHTGQRHATVGAQRLQAIDHRLRRVGRRRGHFMHRIRP